MQQQTIAIFGATTTEGTFISTSLAGGKHKLLLFEGDQLADVQWLVMDLRRHFPSADIEAVSCQLDAAWEADIIVTALPSTSFVSVCERIRDVANRKIVVHITEAASEEETNQCALLLPHSKHVTVITEWSGKKTTVFVQSNHAEALNRIADLLDEAGITRVTVNELDYRARA